MQAAQTRCMQCRTPGGVRALPIAAAAVARRLAPGRCMQSPTAQQPLRLVNQQHQQHQQQPQRLQQCSPLRAASDSSSSGGDNSPQRPSLLSWFDRLPQQTQLMVMGGLLLVATVVIPFLQPTFLYGDGGMNAGLKSGSGQTTEVQDMYVKHELPRYIPVASELYSFLQDNAMPRKLPDGRSESPGVLRIYLASMTILAAFYMCSAVVSLTLRGVAGVLRAVGIMGPAPPAPKSE